MEILKITYPNFDQLHRMLSFFYEKEQRLSTEESGRKISHILDLKNYRSG
jgi:hypothetical protein